MLLLQLSRLSSLLCTLALFIPSFTLAIDLDINDVSSIKSAASTIAYGLMKYYTGNNTGDVPGNLPSPYYWWEAGAMFGEMVEYWYYTGDATYNTEVKQAILHQIGPDNDFMPPNQTKTEGNDDHVFWAFTAMTAAELKFEDPDAGNPSWVALAQAVLNEQTALWDAATCGGGLRWQIYSFNAGYDYKNCISNGGYFQLAARLARYTGNSTYVDLAERMYNWFAGTVLMDTTTYQVYDGTSTTNNCTDADHLQWTYNYGTFVAGCAYMYNHTSDAIWLTRLNGFLNQTFATFFPANMGPNIMVEVSCEPQGTCNNDQPAFKAFLTRWLALAAQLVPATHEAIYTRLRVSAKGAAGQCSGSGHTPGTTCGREWNTTVWDGKMGVGEQMSALAAVQSLMIDKSTLAPPITLDTGGTSKSDPSAGTASSSSSDPTATMAVITTGDKAGAAFLTIGLLVSMLGGAGWLVTSE